jgi:DNA ligase (NAD+)
LANPDVAKEIERLSGLLTKYNHEYHVLGRPSISDIEYDGLFDELDELENQNPELKRSDSPTLRVGSDLSSDLPEVEHSIPVLSLDKAYSDEEISKWIDRATTTVGMQPSLVVEEKIDGISIVLYYENGMLKRGVTRGNGFVGNDVTANIRTIGSVPLSIPETLDIAVRGEIYLPIEQFAEMNSQLEVPYANPRNLAAGAVRRIKSIEVASIPLRMFAYEVFFLDASRSTGIVESMSNHLEALALLEQLGFRRNPRTACFFEGDVSPNGVLDLEGLTVGNFDALAGYIRTATAERRNLDYEIDGLVVKVNELEIRERMGFTGHHPRWEIAYKFESPEGVSVVEQVDIQVGRTGRITPVARISPASIGGTTISNVTLHNQEYVDMLELAVGDTVVVSRRGDVIPAVERVIEKNELGNTIWRMPRVCPSCREELSIAGAHHFCLNRSCPAQLRGRLYFFVGKGQMDIENLGPETIDVLVDEGLVADIHDIYGFDIDSLVGLPGFGEKKIELLRAGIANSKSRPFTLVLPSMGIPDVGPKVVELLVEAGIRSIDDLYAISDAADLDRLVEIDGIGEKTAQRIIDEMGDPVLRERIARLRDFDLRFEIGADELPTPEGDVFADQVWCVTGSFEHFKPRSIAIDHIKRLGGKATSNVSGSTTHLLAGEGAGSKLKKATDLGIAIVSEADFLGIIE